MRSRAHTPPRRKGHRGFTLMEITVVLAILATLVSMTVMGFVAYSRYARSIEAETNVAMLADAASRLGVAEDGCPAWPTDVPGMRRAVERPSACFSSLGFRTASGVYYQYSIARTETGFVVEARGDLDGDGETSVFSRASDASETTITDRLE